MPYVRLRLVASELSKVAVSAQLEARGGVQCGDKYSDQTMSRLSLRGILLVLSIFLGWAGLSGSVKLATGRELGVTIAQSSIQDGTTQVDMWRLVRTSDPIGGHEAVSITRTADVSKSDLEFAGLMLRCGERSVEVLIVLVRAFPPQVHPRVEVSAGSATAQFTANVVPPEVLLLLPHEASALAAGSWQAATELAVTVEDARGAIRGVVSLTGLGHALALLRSNCPAP